jgi:hypothetical protein
MPINRGPINDKAREAVAVMEKDGAWSAGLWEKLQKM